MSRLTPHKEQFGFMTFAQNTLEVDYLKMAYVQAMSIKLVMPSAKYAVVIDKHTALFVTDQQRFVFDYIIELENDFANEESWKLSNEWQAFTLTPFKETIKLESDILITRNIMHWLDMFRLRDVVLSTGCRDYKQQLSDCRFYRRVFDDNNLPDTYNGLMYFRYSKTATQFFETARQIYANWPTIRDEVLINCRDPHPTTDVVYALSAKIIGEELCTIPSADFINFVHMKNKINKWDVTVAWPELVMTELDVPTIRINNINQLAPFHYQNKEWLTDAIVEQYERAFYR